jgi:hypothetical protein
MSDSLRSFSIRQDLLYGRTAHTKCCPYLLASLLAAALLGDTFEHPAGYSDDNAIHEITAAHRIMLSVLTACCDMGVGGTMEHQPPRACISR